MEELQACVRRRGKWIRYSALDAKATHDLALGLQRQLAAMPCPPQLYLGMDPAVAHATGACTRQIHSVHKRTVPSNDL